MDMQKKNVLVTGANGFVGSHILEALMARDDVNVIAACRRPDALIPSFNGEVRAGDLRNPAYRKNVLQNVDVVCHAAAWTSVWNHAEESDRLFFLPTMGLLHEAVNAGVKRFIFLSTTSAAAPQGAGDPMAMGNERRLKLWPHLRNVVRIEQLMQKLAGQGTGMLNLRVGLFAGQRYGLGLLPLLTPRLKTHLVPFVKAGRTSMPIVAGEDIGHAFTLAAVAGKLPEYESLFVVGPEVPTAREVLTFLHQEYDLPLPHFSVPFPVAYAFARTMEWLDPLVPWEPLVTRSIIHLLEETMPGNGKAQRLLGYQPRIGWQQAIRTQMAEMAVKQQRPMRMARPLEN